MSCNRGNSDKCSTIVTVVSVIKILFRVSPLVKRFETRSTFYSLHGQMVAGAVLYGQNNLSHYFPATRDNAYRSRTQSKI